VLGALAEQLFLITHLLFLISVAVAEQNAAFAEQSRWSTNQASGSLREWKSTTFLDTTG
jgi:hypothetical protein